MEKKKNHKYLPTSHQITALQQRIELRPQDFKYIRFPLKRNASSKQSSLGHAKFGGGGVRACVFFVIAFFPFLTLDDLNRSLGGQEHLLNTGWFTK